LVTKGGHGGVIWMAGLPIGQNDHAGTHQAQNANNFDAVFERIFDRAIGQIERLTPADAQQPRRR
jgi:hypothetical protein